MLIEVLIPVILDKRCRNKENDQIPRPQTSSEKILEAEECQSCTSGDEEPHGNDDEEPHKGIKNHPWEHHDK